MNYYKWANENLSAPRARAFHEALRKIDDSKWSEEYKEASRVADALVVAHELAVRDQVDTIAAETEARAAELRAQLREIQAKLDVLYRDANDAQMKVRTAVYKSAEHIEATEKARELWQRDDQAVEPLRQALVEKYTKAQAKVGA
jgi:hypothetical protein